MRLVKIYPPTPVTMLTCIRCGFRVDSRKGYADLDGEPFKAYYHPRCASKAASVSAVMKAATS